MNLTAISPNTGTQQRSAAAYWSQLKPIWEASVLELQHPKFSPPLSPTWRLLLLNDGYTTRNLCLATGTDIQADLINTTVNIDPERDRAPAALSLLDHPSTRRQVWLTNPQGIPLMYGVSWWNPALLQAHIRTPNQPIGSNLSANRTELFREMHGLYLGHNPDLETAFQSQGPFWGRHYILWHQQQPITLIAEIFSNRLTEHLGPSQP